MGDNVFEIALLQTCCNFCCPEHVSLEENDCKGFAYSDELGCHTFDNLESGLSAIEGVHGQCQGLLMRCLTFSSVCQKHS